MQRLWWARVTIGRREIHRDYTVHLRPKTVTEQYLQEQQQYNTIQYSFNGINDKYALFRIWHKSMSVTVFTEHTYNEIVNV